MRGPTKGRNRVFNSTSVDSIKALVASLVCNECFRARPAAEVVASSLWKTNSSNFLLEKFETLVALNQSCLPVIFEVKFQFRNRESATLTLEIVCLEFVEVLLHSNNTYITIVWPTKVRNILII